MFFLKGLMKLIIRWAAYRAVVGRYLDRHQPHKGRFTRHDLNRVLEQTWRNFEELLPDAHLEELETLGNRQNVMLGVVTLAMYRAFLAAGVEKEYAIELFSDLGWKFYEKWVVPLRLIARLVARDPQKQMDTMLRIFLRYPFSRPGYDWKILSQEGPFELDIYRCPVHDYFKRIGKEEENIFFKSWCKFDFALAQVMTKGGSYERPHTLSAGNDVCEMKWYGKPKAATNR